MDISNECIPHRTYFRHASWIGTFSCYAFVHRALYHCWEQRNLASLHGQRSGSMQYLLLVLLREFNRYAGSWPDRLETGNLDVGLRRKRSEESPSKGKPIHTSYPGVTA